MSCEVAALSFQGHANYATRSIDFGLNWQTCKYFVVVFFYLAMDQSDFGKSDLNSFENTKEFAVSIIRTNPWPSNKIYNKKGDR